MSRSSVPCWFFVSWLCLLVVGAAAFGQGSASSAHSLEGDWVGALKSGSGEIRAVFHFSKKGSVLVGTVDSPDQGVHGLPCANIAIQNDNVRLRVPQLGAQFVGKMSSDGKEIPGVWQQKAQQAPLKLVRTEIAVIPRAIFIAYWTAVIALAALFLRLACTLCQTDMPTWRRAIISAVLVTLLAYLTFDFSAYIVMRSLRGVATVIPPWYSYQFWFREPIALKWIIISNAGYLKYLPFVFALCVAGTLQVFFLEAQVTFRFGLLITLLQWAATGVAAYVLALLIGVAWSGMGMATAPVTNSNAADTEANSLQVIRKGLADATETSKEYSDKAWENIKDYSDPYLAELKEELAPLIKLLPPAVQEFLDEGGWWLILGALAFIALIWLRSIVLKLARALKPKKKKRKRTFEIDLKEDLTTLGDAFTDEGPERILISGQPARLRLVVLSAGSRNEGVLTEAMVDRVLDWMKPGLAKVAAPDMPRVRVWPPFFSADGFASAWRAKVPIPEPKGKKSHWVLVFGQVTMGKAILHVGLAFYAEQATTLRYLSVKDEQWLSVLAIESSSQPVGK